MRSPEEIVATAKAEILDWKTRVPQSRGWTEGHADEIADALFHASQTKIAIDNALEELVVEITGGDPDKPDGWPFDRITYDYYDESIELKGCKDDLRLCEESQRTLWLAGFGRCWLNHNDGSETYYCKGGDVAGSRKENAK